MARTPRGTPNVPAVVLVGDGPYSRAEVEQALQVEVLGDMPFDPGGASCLERGASPHVRRAFTAASTRAVPRGRSSRSARRKQTHICVGAADV